jgi:hypothetical protein
LPSITATQEFVVPRSIPIALAMMVLLLSVQRQSSGSTNFAVRRNTHTECCMDADGGMISRGRMRRGLAAASFGNVAARTARPGADADRV